MSLDPSGRELNQAWRRKTVSQVVFQPEDSSLYGPVRKKDVCLVPPGVALGHARHSTANVTTLYLYGGRKTVTVRGDLPFMKRLLRHPRFVAESTMGWAPGADTYPWNQVKKILTSLVQGPGPNTFRSGVRPKTFN